MPQAINPRAITRLDNGLRTIAAPPSEAAAEGRLAASGAALLIAIHGREVYAGAAGAATFEPDGLTAKRPLTPDTPVRVASMSKMAVALLCGELAKAGRLDLDADASEYLGFSLRHPGRPNAPITTRMLLSHTSTLVDPEAYWMAHPGRIEDLIGADAFAGPEALSKDPGTHFDYCNLNYGLAATVAETASGVRFDRAVRDTVLSPLGLKSAGFNWSGVPISRRQTGGSLHRLSPNGVWQVQTDGDDILNASGPAVLIDAGAGLSTYRPGQNGTLFGPQGGLRASVRDIAVLAQAFSAGGIGDALAEPVWRAPEVNGVAAEGLYKAYGSGPQILFQQAPGFRDSVFVGHAGEAYGLYGGAWSSPDGSLTIAYFVNGSEDDPPPTRDPQSGFTPWEEALMRLAADALAYL